MEFAEKTWAKYKLLKRLLLIHTFVYILNIIGSGRFKETKSIKLVWYFYFLHFDLWTGLTFVFLTRVISGESLKDVGMILCIPDVLSRIADASFESGMRKTFWYFGIFRHFILLRLGSRFLMHASIFSFKALSLTGFFRLII